jgi:hypothetical protein
VPCILALDTEIGIDNLEKITFLFVAVHNLKASIVPILCALLQPKLVAPITSVLVHAANAIARRSEVSTRGTFQAPLHYIEYMVSIHKTKYCKQHEWHWNKPLVQSSPPASSILPSSTVSCESDSF